MLEPPFADEGLATDLYLLGCRRVDHVVVIRGDLVMQALGSMREQVSVLVNRAALPYYHPVTYKILFSEPKATTPSRPEK